MHIDIKKHKLFKLDPDTRFCKRFNLPAGTWFRIGQKSLWFRYKWLYYDIVDLEEYVFFKYGKKIHRNTWTRWINRTEVYLMAERYLKRRTSNFIDIDEFGQYKDFILSELKLKK